MARTVSITATDSFAVRAQQSEAYRVSLWVGVLLAMFLITCSRRLMGGVVMSADQVFFPTIGVLVVAMAVQIVMLAALRRANRGGVLLPPWVWRGSVVLDLCIPAALLAIPAWYSPRGAVPALTGPPLLLIPLLILTSVLRLRPLFTLFTGLVGTAIHWSLAVRAILVSDAPPNQYPVFLSYGCVLALTAVAGMLVTRLVRAHVQEAAKEAAAHEQAEQRNAAVRRDLTIARDIQRGLLPTGSPDHPGFDIVGMNRPADQTGGDYFDWQRLPDGRLIMVLADVAGHGIGPAMVMAVCRAYARSSAPMVADPVTLMGRLNELLHGDLPSDRFITLVIAIVDQAGPVQLLSAGHGPTLFYRAETREVTEFHGDGMPLGVSPTEEYGPTAHISMAEGDVLVMLTDGFFEWSRPADGEQFGIQRLRETLADCAHADAATILRNLDETVRRFTHGSAQPDDMTAIVMKRGAAVTPKSAPAPAAEIGRDEREMSVSK